MVNSNAIEKIGNKYHLVLVYLFGSKATNTDNKLSDIDIAVLLEKNRRYEIKDLILDLIYEFTRIFKSEKIDILILNKASLAIQYKVISEGKLLFELDKKRKYNYEERTTKLYLDFKKFEEEYYDVMHKQILGE